MFCPNCGKDCGDEGICSSCGHRVSKMQERNIAQGTIEVENKTHDLICYFVQYQPNRTAAIKALRKDTNLSLVEAKKLIDRLFDEQTAQSSGNFSPSYQNLKSAIKDFGSEPYNTKITTKQVQQSNHPTAREECCNLVRQSKRNHMLELSDEAQPTPIGDQKRCPDVDYSRYYMEYRTDRVKAIMALRVDTGMGAVEAKKVIDSVFDSKEGGTNCHSRLESAEDIKSYLDATAMEYCPKCFSTKLFVHKQSTTRAILYYRTPVVRLIGSIFNLCYTLWGKRTECVCLDCGHTWKK